MFIATKLYTKCSCMGGMVAMAVADFFLRCAYVCVDVCLGGSSLPRRPSVSCMHHPHHESIRVVCVACYSTSLPPDTREGLQTNIQVAGPNGVWSSTLCSEFPAAGATARCCHAGWPDQVNVARVRNQIPRWDIAPSPWPECRTQGCFLLMRQLDAQHLICTLPVCRCWCWSD